MPLQLTIIPVEGLIVEADPNKTFIKRRIFSFHSVGNFVSSIVTVKNQKVTVLVQTLLKKITQFKLKCNIKFSKSNNALT